MNNIIRFARALFSLRSKNTWGRFTEVSEISRFNHAISISWSQASEDIALLNVFESKKNGNHVDIGAHHPSRFSNYC